MKKAIYDIDNLSKILSIRVSRSISISRFNKAINNQCELDIAIDANVYSYDICLSYSDNDEAAQSLSRAIQLMLIKINNNHCE